VRIFSLPGVVLASRWVYTRSRRLVPGQPAAQGQVGRGEQAAGGPATKTKRSLLVSQSIEDVKHPRLLARAPRSNRHGCIGKGRNPLVDEISVRGNNSGEVVAGTLQRACIARCSQGFRYFFHSRAARSLAAIRPQGCAGKAKMEVPALAASHGFGLLLGRPRRPATGWQFLPCARSGGCGLTGPSNLVVALA